MITQTGILIIVLCIIVGSLIGRYIKQNYYVRFDFSSIKKFPYVSFNKELVDTKALAILQDPEKLLKKLQAHGPMYDMGHKVDIVMKDGQISIIRSEKPVREVLNPLKKKKGGKKDKKKAKAKGSKGKGKGPKGQTTSKK